MPRIKLCGQQLQLDTISASSTSPSPECAAFSLPVAHYPLCPRFIFSVDGTISMLVLSAGSVFRCSVLQIRLTCLPHSTIAVLRKLVLEALCMLLSSRDTPPALAWTYHMPLSRLINLAAHQHWSQSATQRTRLVVIVRPHGCSWSLSVLSSTGAISCSDSFVAAMTFADFYMRTARCSKLYGFGRQST